MRVLRCQTLKYNAVRFCAELNWKILRLEIPIRPPKLVFANSTEVTLAGSLQLREVPSWLRCKTTREGALVAGWLAAGCQHTGRRKA